MTFVSTASANMRGRLEPDLNFYLQEFAQTKTVVFLRILVCGELSWKGIFGSSCPMSWRWVICPWSLAICDRHWSLVTGLSSLLSFRSLHAMTAMRAMRLLHAMPALHTMHAMQPGRGVCNDATTSTIVIGPSSLVIGQSSLVTHCRCTR